MSGSGYFTHTAVARLPSRPVVRSEEAGHQPFRALIVGRRRVLQFLHGPVDGFLHAKRVRPLPRRKVLQALQVLRQKRRACRRGPHLLGKKLSPKVAILRRHLLESEPISKLCDEIGLQPTVFYIWHKSLRGECIRPGTPLSLDDARRLVSGYVDHYNNVRLNSATGHITPKDMLAERQQEIHAERDRKLDAAWKQRQIRRQEAA
jgi:hypothetical protein